MLGHRWLNTAAILACLFAFSQGQGLDLFTFSEVKSVLERGGSIVLNVDGSECESGIPLPEGEHRFVSMPFRDWAFVRTTDGQEWIRGNDYFMEISNPNDFALGILARQATIQPDGTVEYLLKFSVPTTGEVDTYSFRCALGRTARVFQYEPTLAIDSFYTYQEIKSALLFGKHVEAVMFAEACEDTESWVGPGAQIHYGHRIENFAVFNEAMDDEYIVFYHTNLYANNTDMVGPTLDLTWGSVGYIVYRNGTVLVPYGVYAIGGGENQNPSPPARCEAGVSMQFSSYREQDVSYTTYAEIKDATLKGHEMEAITFNRFCEVVSGDAPNPGVIGHRFDQFQFFEAGDQWGPTEYLDFSTFSITPGGTGVLDDVKLYPNGSVLFDWHRWDIQSAEERSGVLLCNLGAASLFHAISRERGPSFSYIQVMRAIKNEGAVFEMEVRFDDCTRGGQPVAADTISGGVLWETVVRENAQGIDYAFVAVAFNARINRINENSIGLWNSATLFVYPDRTVEIYPRTYDWLGNDVTVNPQSEPILCKLNTGGLDGSVYFFRYP